MIAEALLISALAPAPWQFLDPLSVRAKINNFVELAALEEKYPGYEWKFWYENDKVNEGWQPSPWVFGNWRLYFKRSA